MLSAVSAGVTSICPSVRGLGSAFSAPLLSEFTFMFTLFRSVAIIGLIFYFSPARETGQPQHQTEEERKPAAAPALGPAEAQDGPWNRLVGNFKEEVVRTAVNDKAISDKAISAGVRMSENAARSLVVPAKPAPRSDARLTTPEWALRAAEDPSVRCIYRCNETE